MYIVRKSSKAFTILGDDLVRHYPVNREEMRAENTLISLFSLQFRYYSIPFFCFYGSDSQHFAISNTLKASWDGPVQTIEREETIQEANEEAAAAQNDAVQINHNRVDENGNSIEKRDPHLTQNLANSLQILNIPLFSLFICLLSIILRN